MKKLLYVLGLSVVTAVPAIAVSPTYMNPTAGTMNFYPMMQEQMQREDTLDFVNDSENYKKKREQKDLENENKVRNSNFNPNYAPNYGGTYLHPVHPVQMQFTKGADGSIKIQGIESNSSKIIENNSDKK
ncbi:MAG: hypothetical protein SPL73_07565 [Cyanobacteriota bacterium]|nr:hypothetical protein [Cyanobacteriota bacterium]MDY6364728.1 hypothetical protein [Cyanobacteriota bacterium]